MSACHVLVAQCCRHMPRVHTAEHHCRGVHSAAPPFAFGHHAACTHRAGLAGQRPRHTGCVLSWELGARCSTVRCAARACCALWLSQPAPTRAISIAPCLPPGAAASPGPACSPAHPSPAGLHTQLFQVRARQARHAVGGQACMRPTLHVHEPPASPTGGLNAHGMWQRQGPSLSSPRLAAGFFMLKR